MTKYKYLPLQNCSANFNQTWKKASLDEETQGYTNNYHSILKMEINRLFPLLINVQTNHSSSDWNWFLRWAMWPMDLLFKLTFVYFSPPWKTFCLSIMASIYNVWFLCPRDRRSGGILVLSCLSFCHSVILTETLTLLITFEHWMLELWIFTWVDLSVGSIIFYLVTLTWEFDLLFKKL